MTKIASSEPQHQPLFFILGSQRSGTTLLRLILNNHSRIAIPTESTFLMPLLNQNNLLESPEKFELRKPYLREYFQTNSQFKKWNINSELFDGCLDNTNSTKEFMIELYRAYARNTEKKYVGDKTPPFIRKAGLIRKYFPDAMFIHIIRDGRDAYLSLKQKHAAGTNSVALGALEWASKMKLLKKQLKDINDDVICVRYEDLVRDPETVTRQICDFLNITYEVHMLEFWKDSDNHIAKHHSALIFKPINSGNIEKWKTAMSESDNVEFCYIAGDTLDSFGYPCAQDRPGIFQAIRIWLGVIRHIIPRLYKIAKTSFKMRLAARFGKPVDDSYYT